MTLDFYKYQGTGNDFIIIDNRNGAIQLSTEQVKFLCDRRFGIGADGLMFLQEMQGYDFEMAYYNADGRPGSMCGNGGRCITRFAYDMGIHKGKYVFMASDGRHEAIVSEDSWVRLKMKDVQGIQHQDDHYVLNTGSPHYVKPVSDVVEIDVYHEGRQIRYNPTYEKEGINVNFAEQNGQILMVRTYERGVENETYSCGTGVTAAALVFANDTNGYNRVGIQTKGGELAVEFDKKAAGVFENIWLCGPANFVFTGQINI